MGEPEDGSEAEWRTRENSEARFWFVAGRAVVRAAKTAVRVVRVNETILNDCLDDLNVWIVGRMGFLERT